MTKYSLVIIIICVVFSISLCHSQVKYEREHRIKKSQFPENALAYISEKLEGAKRIRFYKEIDSAKTTFEAKFKKKKLKYSIAFEANGNLHDVEITVREVDIPNDSWANIQDYLTEKFKKVRVRKIQQQYPVTKNKTPENTLKNAFQNLLIPSLNYEIIVTGKKENVYRIYEILFDAEGNFIKMRQSPPANYDHVLY